MDHTQTYLMWTLSTFVYPRSARLVPDGVGFGFHLVLKVRHSDKFALSVVWALKYKYIIYMLGFCMTPGHTLSHITYFTNIYPTYKNLNLICFLNLIKYISINNLLIFMLHKTWYEWQENIGHGLLCLKLSVSNKNKLIWKTCPE